MIIAKMIYKSFKFSIILVSMCFSFSFAASKTDSTYGGTKKFFDPAAVQSEKNIQDESERSQVSYNEIEGYSVDTNLEKISSNKQKIIADLFNRSSKDLDWPPLPRSWIERSIVKQKNLSETLGLQISPFRFGLKLKDSVNKSYSVKVSIVLASSTLPVHPRRLSHSTPDDESNANYHPLLVVNPNDRQIYPNVSSKYPMIGFCSFESKYVVEKSNSKGASFFGSEINLDEAASSPVVYLYTSKLFQISKDISIRQYLYSICGDIFRNQFEEKIHNDLQMLRDEIEYNLEMSELSKQTGDCHIDSNSEEMPFVESDDSCVAWQKYHFNDRVIRRTVARCEYNKLLNKHKCNLRTRENKTCPIYWDVRNKQFTTEYKPHFQTLKATKSEFEFPCDVKNGLTCRFLDEPVMLFNTPFWQGTGICEKK